MGGGVRKTRVLISTEAARDSAAILQWGGGFGLPIATTAAMMTAGRFLPRGLQTDSASRHLNVSLRVSYLFSFSMLGISFPVSFSKQTRWSSCFALFMHVLTPNLERPPQICIDTDDAYLSKMILFFDFTRHLYGYLFDLRIIYCGVIKARFLSFVSLRCKQWPRHINPNVCGLQ